VLKFDCAQDTWSQVARMPEPISAFAACAVGSDIFMFGGRNTGYQEQAFVFKYDTEADTWSTLTPMPDVSSGHSASVLDGMIYIVGAGDGGRAVFRFDPVLGAWSTLTPLLTAHREATSFVLGGKLYVSGGLMISSVERYDAATNTWTEVTDMLKRRSYFAAVTIGSVGPAEEQDLIDSLIAKANRRGD
jgi:N-acetylneuraminic acid mutarotase